MLNRSALRPGSVDQRCRITPRPGSGVHSFRSSQRQYHASWRRRGSTLCALHPRRAANHSVLNRKGHDQARAVLLAEGRSGSSRAQGSARAPDAIQQAARMSRCAPNPHTGQSDPRSSREPHRQSRLCYCQCECRLRRVCGSDISKSAGEAKNDRLCCHYADRWDAAVLLVSV